MVKRTIRPSGGILIALAIALGAGIAICIALSLSASDFNVGVAFLLVGYMFAAAAAFSIVGFIFGVPKTKEQSAQAESGRFAASSSLEQISDWLTKIIIGATLVQVATLPGALAALGRYLATGLSLPNAPAVAISVVVYGASVGFLMSYLWARLILRTMVESTESDAIQLSQAGRRAAEFLADAEETAGSKTSKESIDKKATHAAELADQAYLSGPILWVDDHVENILDTVKAFRVIGVDVDLARSTDEALSLLESRNYRLIITDLGRNESSGYNRSAGLDLNTELLEKGSKVPIFVYTSKSSLRRSAELHTAGIDFVTSAPTELFARAVQQLKAQ
ncbi:hypothetical protein [Herbiconiux sp. VKM Ac-2851]|uniref:hypothetical protein n=1 Tax=Herbiconiux sp. VKM Ac-2851 TaxID=2739025 RepID=UPI001565B13D|nr:hypothetical protein [Herbiconiux sp. VKM Ac-2851]NQX33289.1 hypothetical protein [Herbiconiux sp. VKM Ac-2851]